MSSSGISEWDNGKGTSNILEGLSYSEKYLSEAFKYTFHPGEEMQEGQHQTNSE